LAMPLPAIVRSPPTAVSVMLLVALSAAKLPMVKAPTLFSDRFVKVLPSVPPVKLKSLVTLKLPVPVSEPAKVTGSLPSDY